MFNKIFQFKYFYFYLKKLNYLLYYYADINIIMDPSILYIAGWLNLLYNVFYMHLSCFHTAAVR